MVTRKRPFAKLKLCLWLAFRFLMHQGTEVDVTSARSDKAETLLQPAHRVSLRRRIRNLFSRLGLPAILSLIGLATGVASLTVAMAVVSSYETTFTNAIVDVFGHVLVVKRGDEAITTERAVKKIESARSDVVAVTPFINFEGIVVGAGKLSGVLVQGVDEKSVDQVLRLKPRLVKGDFSIGDSRVLVGRAVAERYGLELGSEIKVVIPRPISRETTGFDTKVARYKVSGIVDLGKYDYDERAILTSIDDARQTLGISAPFVGLRVKLRDAKVAPDAVADLKRALGPDWWASDWTEGNRNLLRAIKYERVPIFLVIFIIMIAASFNVSSNIFIGVLRRTMDISVLRALGLSARDVAWIFRLQGGLFGVIGSLVGVMLGFALGGAFILAQKFFVILPPDVYRLSHIGAEFHGIEVVLVSISAICICLIAALAPAKKAGQLIPIEGLRND